MAKKAVLEVSPKGHASPKGPISPREMLMLKAFDLRNVRDSLSLYPQAASQRDYGAVEEEEDDTPEDGVLTSIEEEQEAAVLGMSLLPRPALIRMPSVDSILPLSGVKEEVTVPEALVPPVGILPLPDVAEEEGEDDAPLLPRPGLVRAVSVVESVLPLPDVEKEQEVTVPGDAGDIDAPDVHQLHFSMLPVLPPISSGSAPQDADDEDAPALLPKPPLVRALSLDVPPLSSDFPPSSLRAEFGDYNEGVQITGSSASVESGDESSSS